MQLRGTTSTLYAPRQKFFPNYIAKNKLQKIRPMLWFQFLAQLFTVMILKYVAFLNH